MIVSRPVSNCYLKPRALDAMFRAGTLFCEKFQFPGSRLPVCRRIGVRSRSFLFVSPLSAWLLCGQGGLACSTRRLRRSIFAEKLAQQPQPCEGDVCNEPSGRREFEDLGLAVAARLVAGACDESDQGAGGVKTIGRASCPLTKTEIVAARKRNDWHSAKRLCS
jgi:hypothetical protein